jgi:hypothetical protein
LRRAGCGLSSHGHISLLFGLSLALDLRIGFGRTGLCGNALLLLSTQVPAHEWQVLLIDLLKEILGAVKRYLNNALPGKHLPIGIFAPNVM